MSVGIQVAIRCRPFAVDGQLGVRLRQLSEEEGEVELINCEYTTTRFPFTYAWWSAYGYKRHMDPNDKNLGDADDMVLVTQEMVYDQVGEKIKKDLMGGSAVVLFAYGLSGSGKTFTVFGPDASDAPEAWFKHKEPQPQWGILPRLAYNLFEMREDSWKFTMKYFQNVVDTVRDLMSPNAEEQHYKNGMRKDPDGFMDIEWCIFKVINSWNELRSTFTVANGRKAIAPTQFNAMSTRGHCVMVLEIEMPNPDNESSKLRGRVYVCDLAGTEPAGDIVYAMYQKMVFDDGSFEYKFLGAHADKKKTLELQDQGKKINLSLSEMAQFFMKMAEAHKAKKLKPGMSIPGCNSFFLCKYLKDTMLQARTYLFCAIRPEVEFLKYTFSTLGFARNASVVRLAPKKATTSCSPLERKLMAELEEMKLLVEQLRKQNTKGASIKGGSGPDEESARMIAELQARLKEKEEAVEHGDPGESANAQAEQQRAEYARRGISLAAYETDVSEPYFINLEEDAFRSNRLMYIIRKSVTVFGMKGDIAPMSLSVVREHCFIKFDGESVFIIGGKGDTWLNGMSVAQGVEKKLEIFDRLAMGDQLMLFRWAGHEPEGVEPMSGEDAVNEFQEGLINNRNKGGHGGAESEAAAAAMEEERKRILEEREKWENEKNEIRQTRNEQEFTRAMASVDNQILDLLPKAKEAKQTVDLFNRVTMSFDIVLEKGVDHIPKVKVSVENSNPKLSILIDPTEFLPKLSLLKDEMMKLRGAIDGNREYEVPERHDPLYLMFDNDFLLGTATHWPEYLLYNLETDEEERMQDIKNAAVPYNTVGLLEVRWTPLGGPEKEQWNLPPPDVESEDELLGQPWTYRLEIKRATDLPVFCEMAYIEYEFFGEVFTTEVVQQTTFSPIFEYSFVHHVERVTPEFIAFLKGSLEMHVHVTQHVDPPAGRISTSNPIVVDSIRSGQAKGYDVAGAAKPKSEADLLNDELQRKLADVTAENTALQDKVRMLELRISQLEGRPKSRQALDEAKMVDMLVNGNSSEKKAS